MRKGKHPGIQIKKRVEDLPGFEKPYLGWRPGHGMPSARKPVESLDLSGEKAYQFEERTYNRKNPVICREECQFRSKRKANLCSVHFDVSKCDQEKFKNMEIKLTPYRMVPTLKGLGMYDKTQIE
jgi:hypothetical protein